MHKKLTILLVIIVCLFFQVEAGLLDNYCTKIYSGNNIEVSLYEADMFRLRFSNLRGKNFPNKYEIPFVIGRLKKWDQVEYTILQSKNVFALETKKIRIKINLETYKWEVFSTEGNKIYPSDAKRYGMFQNGCTVFDNASFFNEHNHNSRYSHWFYNPETGRYVDTYLEKDLILDKYFIYGPDYKTIYKKFNKLVGPEPLLPKKAFGFFQTQHLACEGSQEKLFEVVNKFRQRDIPLDNIIIDFEWGDACKGKKEIKWGSSLNWNKNYQYPLSPDEMLDSLDNRHLNVMLIHHNAPKFNNRFNQGWTECEYDENIWWQKFYHKLDIGVDGTWQDTRRNDITDGVIWNGIQDYYDAQRRVLFMGCRRMQMINPWDSSFTIIPYNQMIGARRYPFDWTGDCSYYWSELRWQIKAITNIHGSLKGVSYITSDAIGINWKVQARWNQFACFSAVARSHNPKPWSGGIDFKSFVDKIRITDRNKNKSPNKQNKQKDPEHNAEASIKKYLNLRYRLVPYIYTYAHENYETGIPICRPMMISYPDDYKCAMNQWPYQYMFGNEMLIAPVYGNFKKMEIYLPKGEKWIDFWNGDTYKGGGILNYNVTDISKLPIFVKKGAIIPMQKQREWLENGPINDPVILHLYPAIKQSKFTLYEDDGFSTKYQKGRYLETEIKLSEDEEKIYIDIGKMVGKCQNKPNLRKWKVILHATERPENVLLNNKLLDKISNNEGNGSIENDSWLYIDNKIVIEFSAKTHKHCKLIVDKE